jgi:hypothetical protein
MVAYFESAFFHAKARRTRKERNTSAFFFFRGFAPSRETLFLLSPAARHL